MRRFIAGAFLILVIPLAATAQEYPTAEVFGGYSYLRADADGIGYHGHQSLQRETGNGEPHQKQRYSLAF